ncbi:MAG: ferredoxin [Chromatiaceae bacterium]|nr:ferredoxin [Chromatiaceae bacterium]
MSINPGSTTEQRTQIPGPGPENIPTLPTAVKDAKATRELMFTLRHFHLGAPAAKDQLEAAPDDALPALLDPFRDTSKLRYDYPLFLFPPGAGDGHQDADDLEQPLAEWFARVVQEFAPAPDSARILKDHLHWLEYHLRGTLRQREGPAPAKPVLRGAGVDLQRHLDLDPANRDRLQEDLDQLQAAAGDGQIMGYGRYPALHLLIHAVRSRVIPRLTRFQVQVDECIRGLRSLIDVEWGKSDEAIEPRQARDSVGPEGERFNPAALSAVMDHSKGTQQMPAERRERIERVLEILVAWHPDPVLVRFVHLGSVAGHWLSESYDTKDVTDDDPCARATVLFDHEAEKLAGIFAAVRIAQLEIQGIYDPAIHDPWFDNFHWEAFSQEELLLVPSVIALDDADRVAGRGLHSFSRLLSSGRPVQIMVRIQAHNNPGAQPDENPFQAFRTELGYLGISHRQAVVTQSSAARHHHLMRCFLAALDATHTSLNLITTGLRPESRLVRLNAWLVAGAGIEGRAHPFFRINPAAGDFAAARMDFSENPEETRDWPVHPFRYRDENANLIETEQAFTFADYCLLIERLRDHFRIIPPGCDSTALVPVSDYLARPQEEADRLLPFIWAVDGNNLLHRLVISRELILACRDRLNFWRSLQELAGVRNRYVEMAIERTRTEERQQAAVEHGRLQAEHAVELEKVRESAAREAMQRLTDVLLGMDLTGGAGASAPAPEPIPRPVAEEPPRPVDDMAKVAAAIEPEPSLSFDEPWIDTTLCTSCNDCTNLNPLLFVYNEDKQALLGDLGAGTYAQIVEAAELCPANCIHPGKPWDPDEPGLGELIERAVPFNQ